VRGIPQFLLLQKNTGQTFSGSATIIWQSINIPGMLFETHARTGAPSKTYEYLNHNVIEYTNSPIVMFGTKWLFEDRLDQHFGLVDVSYSPVHDIFMAGQVTTVERKEDCYPCAAIPRRL
jgi:hypothetical protein